MSSQHVAGVPLTPAVAERLHQVYLSKGIHGTASIEGNTLSEDEVLARIEGELPLPQLQEYLGREIDNIVDVCNQIVARVLQGEAGISVDVIKEYNRSILSGLPLKDNVVPGEVRDHSVTVGISSYRGAPAAECEELLARLVEWLNEMRAPDDRPELRFPFAVLKSILAHLYIAWIHPFGDGNGRTARLIEFQLMVEAGAPIPAAHLLSDHYNRSSTKSPGSTTSTISSRTRTPQLRRGSGTSCSTSRLAPYWPGTRSRTCRRAWCATTPTRETRP